jgi:hypothetical protein
MLITQLIFRVKEIPRNLITDGVMDTARLADSRSTYAARLLHSIGTVSDRFSAGPMLSRIYCCAASRVLTAR